MLPATRIASSGSTVPFVLAGVRAAVGVAWKSVIAAEVLSQPVRAIGILTGSREAISSIPLEYYLSLSAIIFSIGVIGVLTRRNAIIIFMCIELMLNADKTLEKYDIKKDFLLEIEEEGTIKDTFTIKKWWEKQL